MLITDLEYFKNHTNYKGDRYGLDSEENCSENIHWFKTHPVQNFDYNFNSWGFRGPEYDTYIGQPVNICVGDSFTVNVGGPIEDSWPSLLAKHFDIPTINLGMAGAGNDAFKLVYERACKIFDVQDTFVMYSYLHRRLVNNEFTQQLHNDSENFEYFLNQRIPNVFECALPSWNYTHDENQFLSRLEIYFFNEQLYFSDCQEIDRKKFIDRNSYDALKGSNWPTLEQFVQGAEPHPDMLTKEFGNFVSDKKCKNRDGHHMNQETNKVYADYFYNQWKQRNESQNTTQT